jgi:hypothetical protein
MGVYVDSKLIYVADGAVLNTTLLPSVQARTIQ